LWRQFVFFFSSNINAEKMKKLNLFILPLKKLSD